MKVKYKEEPRAWRKSTLFSVVALLVLCSLLRWRHILGTWAWVSAMGLLLCAGMFAWARPRWFRGYYRFSTWAGFWSSQAVARVVLAIIFILMIIPAGVMMRLLGKDPLRLKRSPHAPTYWSSTKQSSPLDRLF